MNRQALKLPFTLNGAPDWQCPTCQVGIIRIKKESFQKEEKRRSRDHSYPEWDPELIEYVYSCLLVCSNDQCKEVVSSSGVGSVESYVYEDEQTGETGQGYDDSFRPKHFEPHLELLSIPAKCPDSVSTPLRDSFRVFFSCPSAASNCVRIALEELLTALNVKRFSVAKGRKRYISLHERISLLPARFAPLRDILVAIKWLGNAGSHGTGDGKAATSIDDVMDSYEFMEHILHEIYTAKAKRLLASAKRVNKRKGPVK